MVNKLVGPVYAVEHRAVVPECAQPKRPAMEPYKQSAGTVVDGVALP